MSTKETAIVIRLMSDEEIAQRDDIAATDSAVQVLIVDHGVEGGFREIAWGDDYGTATMTGDGPGKDEVEKLIEATSPIWNL